MSDLILKGDLAWSELGDGLRSEFTRRLLERLPQLDPETEWDRMTPRGRQDLRWHLQHTRWALRDCWETECERLRIEADEATTEAFRVLAGLVIEG
jgi:hypothetical protein